jgi:hypothetical protein
MAALRLETMDEKDVMQLAIPRAAGRCLGCEDEDRGLFVQRPVRGYFDRAVPGYVRVAACFIALCRECGKIHNRSKGKAVGDGTPDTLEKLFRR